MKKVRIQLAPNVAEGEIHLYESVEALFEGVYSGIPPEEDEFCYIITLRDDEYAEVEWLGCEIDYSPDGKTTTYNYVRLAKVLNPGSESGLVVSVYVGWSLSDAIPFAGLTGENLVIHKITESTIDFRKILEEDEDSSKEESIDSNVN